jgi:hypothetical protein
MTKVAEALINTTCDSVAIHDILVDGCEHGIGTGSKIKGFESFPPV